MSCVGILAWGYDTLARIEHTAKQDLGNEVAGSQGPSRQGSRSSYSLNVQHAPSDG